MVATLPGRTHGLGLITEPLLDELQLGRVSFAALNFWATILGALFCLPVGWLCDRLGVRIVLGVVLAILGGVVLWMANLPKTDTAVALPSVEFSSGFAWLSVPLMLFVLVLLTRGFGQSALSVVSLTLLGQASGSKPGAWVGLYSFLVAVGFMVAFGGVKYAFEQQQATWRSVWSAIALCVLGFAVLSLFLGTLSTAKVLTADADTTVQGFTVAAALRTQAFWVFALATSFYGLVASGTSLFNQSILAERGFNREVFLTISVLGPLIGLAANLLTGWLATKVRLGRLLAISLVIQSAALGCFPLVRTYTEVYAYATAMGVAGGMLTVVFFTVWRQAYGTAHLGKIQGIAQLLTVLASAAGPLVLACGHQALGNYAPVVQSLAVVGGVFTVWAWFVKLPASRSEA